MSRGRCAAVDVAWKLGTEKLKILAKPRLLLTLAVTVAWTMFQFWPEGAGKLPLELLVRGVVDVAADVQAELRVGQRHAQDGIGRQPPSAPSGVTPE